MHSGVVIWWWCGEVAIKQCRCGCEKCTVGHTGSSLVVVSCVVMWYVVWCGGPYG